MDSGAGSWDDGSAPAPLDPSKMTDQEWLDWRAKGMPNAPAPAPTPAPPSSGPSGDQSPDPIGPNTRRFLYDTISPGESGGRYDIIYGGAKGPQFFSDYSKHPNQRSDIPDSGLTSDAAGRYQFLSSTWNPIAAKLGLKDFSPDNQDRGAAYLASTTYKAATGRDLETDLADPSRRGSIIAALTPQWPSLGKGGGGRGTMVASNQPAQQDQQPNYLTQMAQMQAQMINMLMRQRQRPAIDPMYAKLQLMQALMPQQQQAPVAHDSKFPWVNALLQQGPNPMQAVMNAYKMRALADGSGLSGLS